jgi:hypothetical protein
MRVTIIPSNGFVSVDNEGYFGVNLSFIPPTVHAVQWYGASGEVENKDAVTGKKTTNVRITSLADFQPAITAWQSAKATADAAKKPVPEPVIFTYVENRAREYPDFRDYLDGVVKNDQAQIAKYIAGCLAVKAKYPKP